MNKPLKKLSFEDLVVAITSPRDDHPGRVGKESEGIIRSSAARIRGMYRTKPYHRYDATTDKFIHHEALASKYVRLELPHEVKSYAKPEKEDTRTKDEKRRDERYKRALVAKRKRRT